MSGSHIDEKDMDRRIAFGRELIGSLVPMFAELFGKVDSQWKSDGSRVTEADILLSRACHEGVVRAFPEDQFFSEELEAGEQTTAVKQGFSWILDPIDGTNNFARGLPCCSGRPGSS